MASRSPIPLTRRRLLAASGATLAAGAPVVLAACGNSDEDEDVSPERQAELLNAVLAQQLAVVEAVDPASSSAPEGLQGVFDRLSTLRQTSARELRETITALDGTPTSDAADLAGGESPTEGVKRQLEASIAATLEPLGELPPDRRQPVHLAITEDAAALAAIRDALGEDPAPDAFVMGPPASAKEAA